MKIYTKTGDAGTTGLFGGPRVAKDDRRICAYGSVDELNAVIGIARATELGEKLDPILSSVQHHLFSIGAELATPNPEEHGLKWAGSTHVEQMEQSIDELETSLKPLRNFILPGGSTQAAHLHLARTVCRRTEREIVSFSREPSQRLVVCDGEICQSSSRSCGRQLGKPKEITRMLHGWQHMSR